jgi:hypothetical protein
MQFAGIDFPSLFDKDNFTLRRTTGHNMFDPESLISDEEIAHGMDFKNSKRAWRHEAHYIDAVTGTINTTEVLRTAPRVFLIPGCPSHAEMGNRLEELYAFQMEGGTDLVERGD